MKKKNIIIISFVVDMTHFSISFDHNDILFGENETKKKKIIMNHNI